MALFFEWLPLILALLFGLSLLLLLFRFLLPKKKPKTEVLRYYMPLLMESKRIAAQLGLKDRSRTILLLLAMHTDDFRSLGDYLERHGITYELLSRRARQDGSFLENTSTVDKRFLDYFMHTAMRHCLGEQARIILEEGYVDTIQIKRKEIRALMPRVHARLEYVLYALAEIDGGLAGSILHQHGLTGQKIWNDLIAPLRR